MSLSSHTQNQAMLVFGSAYAVRHAISRYPDFNFHNREIVRSNFDVLSATSRPAMYAYTPHSLRFEAFTMLKCTFYCFIVCGFFIYIFWIFRFLSCEVYSGCFKVSGRWLDSESMFRFFTKSTRHDKWHPL